MILLPRLVFLALLLCVSPVAALEINTSGGDGMSFHMPSSSTVPQYNLWNHTNADFNSWTNSARDVGGSARWMVVRGNHERDEFLGGILDANLDINIQFFNGTTWYNLTALTASAGNSANRGFDIAAEETTGDWLVAYENSPNEDRLLAYRTITLTENGTVQISDERTIDLNLTGQIRWVKLIPRPRSDAVMLMMMDNAQNISAQLWNGTAFDNTTNLTLTTTSGFVNSEAFDFAWEGQNGDGIGVYGSDVQYRYRNFTFASRTWSNEAPVFTLNGGAPNQVALCSQPSSDYIGMIFQDNTNDVNVRVWNGSTVETVPVPPSEDVTTESGVNAKMVSCFWNNDANLSVFAFVDSAIGNKDNVKYTTYNKTAWNVSALQNAPLGPDQPTAAPLRGILSAVNSVRNETMLTLLTSGSRMTMLQWNGVAFVFPTSEELQNSTSCTAGQQQCAAFDWTRFDPPPTVRNVSSNASTFNLNTVLNTSANVTDNLNVDVVFANVSLPNGTTIRFALYDVDANRVYNGLLNVTDQNGRYNYTIIANDTSLHDNVNATESALAYFGDAWSPNVTNVLPLQDTNYPLNAIINISANVTDNVGVDRVYANVTYPNRSTVQFRLINLSAANFSSLLNETSQRGRYNVTIIANDTTINVNNINSSERTSFRIDAIPPTVTNVSPPTGTNINRTLPINISVNVSDDIALSVVLTNITYPNGSTLQFRLWNTTEQNFSGQFNTTEQNGFYNVTIIANDTVNNINDTERTRFSAGDVVPPTITLTAPANNSNTSSTSVVVAFIPVDDKNVTLNCTANVNGSTQSNTSVVNGSTTTFTFSSLTNGTYSWNVTCEDEFNTNTSLQQRFTVDTQVPNFISLTTDPNSAETLDPGVTITTIGNVTDNHTAVDTVILQYKLSTAADYTNATMSQNSTTLLWNASFTASANGTYVLRMVATDTVGNSDTSQNITRNVQTDYGWNRTPERFVPVGILKGENGTLGILILNNTADFPFNFTVTSDFANTTFNTTFPIQLNASNVSRIQVNASAPGTAQTLPVVLTISASPNATPASITTNATIIVTNTQPFLAATFSTVPNTVTRGQEGVEISGQVENIGTANASNVTLFFTVPAEWVLTSGDLNVSTGELNVGETLTSTLSITIPANATTGDQNVTINTTGVNNSGSSLPDLGLVLGEVKIVTVSDPSEPLGGGGSGSGGAGGSGSGGGGEGGGSSSGPGPLEKTLEGRELLETRQRVELTRGEQQTFPLAITNVFANTTLYDVTVEVGGYLSQYITIDPPKVTDIRYGETKYVNVTLAAPAYKDRALFDLLFIIKGRAFAKQQYTDADGRLVTVNTVKEITERRTVTLIIHEFARGIALSYREIAEKVYAEFVAEGIPAQRIGALLAELNVAYSEQDFGTVKRISERMAQLRDEAFAAKDALAQTRKRIAHAQGLGLATLHTEELLLLAQTAFDREDFTLATRRAREAQAAYLLETQARFDTIGFLQTYWWQLLTAVALLSAAGAIAYQRAQARILTHRLRSLEHEEGNIHALVADLQKQVFGDRTISLSSYQKLTKEYEKRLIRIQQIRIQLRTKRAALLSPADEEAQLNAEYQQIAQEMLRSQQLYLNEKKLSRYHFFAQVESQKRRMAELERERLTAHVQRIVDAQHPQRRAWGALQQVLRTAERESRNIDQQARGTWRTITEREQELWRKLEQKLRKPKPAAGMLHAVQGWLRQRTPPLAAERQRGVRSPMAVEHRELAIWRWLERRHQRMVIERRRERVQQRQRERLRKLLGKR